MTANRIEKKLTRWFRARDLEPSAVFLVGGAVRDHLLMRPCADLDLVCLDADDFARRLADSRRAALVRFEKKPGEACLRVVDRDNPGDYLDLVELRNGNISDDLARRDFTINAMAMRVDSGGRLGDLIDPHGGFSDLKKKIVRMVGPEAFADDPLRLLRAWRFAAELGFRIEATTRGQLADQAQRLKTVAVERIVYELFRILNLGEAGLTLREMARTPVLEALFPEKAVAPGHAAQRGIWDNSLAIVDRLEAILGSTTTYFGSAASRLAENFRAGNRLPILKLAVFYSDSGQLNGGTAEQTAEMVGRRLKVSNRDRLFFQCVLGGLGAAFAIAAGHRSRSRLIEFFRAREDDGVGSLVLALAILSADTVEIPSGVERPTGAQALCGAIVDYYSEIKAKLAEKPLIVGQDLIDAGMSPGPRLGDLLREVRRVQDEGRVTSRSEALEWIHRHLPPQK